ncbi:MAG: hypothetical protein M5U14_22055 [Acidimicrobiia bacterium]|nr:hypothetical protein [Acidimicrobiia bacterium]
MATTQRDVDASRLAPDRSTPEGRIAALTRRIGFPAGFRALQELSLVVGVVAVAVTVQFQLWRAHFRVPWVYSGDGLLSSMLVRRVVDEGWYLESGRMGAPFTSSRADFPTGGENIHYLTTKLIGYVVRDWAVTVNLYFLAGFFLVGVSAYLVARYLRLTARASLVVAVLYSFLPFHLSHGVAHLARSAYYIVPVAVLVILWVIDYRSEIFAPEGDGRSRWRVRRGRFGFALAVCGLLGMSDTQNAAFFVVLLVLSAVVLGVAHRDLRPIALAGLLALVVGAVLVVNNVPYLVERIDRGKNPEVADRQLIEGEIFALRPAKLVLPVERHRVPALRSLTDRALAGMQSPGEGGEALGLVGAAGLLGGLYLVGRRLLANDRASRAETSTLPTRAGALALVAVLMATVSGGSFIAALSGATMLRTWNRIVVYIGFLALVVAGWAIDRALARLGSGGRALRLAWGLVALVVVVGLLDQTTRSSVPSYGSLATRFDSDAEFFHRVEALVGPGAMVFQYPVVPFPEWPPVVEMTDYEHIIAYLHTDDVRWSYGAMRGRPEGDWQRRLGDLSFPAAIAAEAAVGYDGIMVNREGFVDGGAELEGALQSMGGVKRLASPDDRLLYYDLVPAREGLERAFRAGEIAGFRSALLSPVSVTWGSGFHARESDGVSVWRWSDQESVLELDNHQDTNRRVSVEANLVAESPGATIVLEGAGKEVEVRMDEAGSGRLEAVLDLPPGRTDLAFSTDADRIRAPNDSRSLYVLFVEPTIVDRAIDDLVGWAEERARPDRESATPAEAR